MRTGIISCSLFYPQPWESASHLIVLKYLNKWMDEIYFYSLRIIWSRTRNLLTLWHGHHTVFLRYIEINWCGCLWSVMTDWGFGLPQTLPGCIFRTPLGNWSQDQILHHHLSLFPLLLSVEILMSLPSERNKNRNPTIPLTISSCYPPLPSELIS